MLRFGTACVAGILLVQGSVAQTHRDFSGTWKMDPARSESAHQDVPVGASTIVIRQTPEEISVETTRAENGRPDGFHETLRFRMDGSETTSEGNAGARVTGKLRWEGAKLITETARNVAESTVTTLYVHTLSPNGKELTVDKSLTVQHGYQFRGAATTGRGKDVFVRVSE